MVRKFYYFIFTFICCDLFNVLYANSSLISEENLKTHLRLSLKVPKDQIVVKTDGLKLYIQTLNLDLFGKLVAELDKVPLNNNYFVNRFYSSNDYPNTPATITFHLKNNSIEAFAFYRKEIQDQVIDFWSNDMGGTSPPENSQTPKVVDSTIVPDKKIVDSLPATTAPAKNPELSLNQNSENNKNNVSKNVSSTTTAPITPVVVTEAETETDVATDSKVYRDFRYGSSFIWDYEPMGPSLEKDFDINAKSIEDFYPFKDFKLDGDEKNAHMQLSLNFYRKNSYGLMNKSINLYSSKYGKDSNENYNRLLKVNSLIKTNIGRKDHKLAEAINNELLEILASAKDYELKQILYRYLIQYNRNKKDYLKTIELTESFLREAQKIHDIDNEGLATKILLFSLAQLNQETSIEKITQDPKIKRSLAAQDVDAYLSYLYLKKNKELELIKHFENNQKSYGNKIHPMILYNVGESYFREAQYQNALKLFDQFISQYSYFPQASFARGRIAVMFDLLEKSPDQIEKLYEEAINKSSQTIARFEAKIRYVGFVLNRKYQPGKDDFEKMVFLDASELEAKLMTPNLQKLLWLTRLRTLIQSKKYDVAYDYLESVPLDMLGHAEARTFLADGSEIIIGKMQQHLDKKEFELAIKDWEMGKAKYEKYSAKNPYALYLVCESYFQLQLKNLFQKNLQTLISYQKEKLRTFPIWVDTKNHQKLDLMIEELKLKGLMLEGKYANALESLNKLSEEVKANLPVKFYQGLLFYKLEKYSQAIESFSSSIDNKKQVGNLMPDQQNDLVEMYVESMFKERHQSSEKYRQTIQALVKDLKQSKNSDLKKLLPRIEYVGIELHALMKNADHRKLMEEIEVFSKNNSNNAYEHRLKFLKALSYIQLSQVEKGKDILEKLISGKDTPLYLKEGAKTELNQLTLKKESI